MTTDLFLNSIKEWFDEYEHQLREIVAEVDGERRSLIECEKSLEPRLLEYSNLNYVIACVEEPIRKILRFIKENRKCQVLDDSVSSNSHVEIEDVVLFLKVLPIEYRKMLLKGFDGAIRDNPIVSEGVLQANLDKLMEAAQRFDLSEEFTQIGFLIAFAQKYGTKSEQRLQLAEDILTIKYINNGFTEIRKFFLLDKERDAGKRIWPWLEEFCAYYREMTYCFTNQEKAMINRLLQDEHFKFISKKMGVDVELIINGESLGATEVSTLTIDSNEPATVEPQPEQLSVADINQEIPKKFTKKQKDIINNFDIRDTYFEVDPDESPDYCTIVNEKFKNIDKVERAKKFEAFIKLLVRQHCIAPVNVVMQSCAYNFTGIEFQSPYEHVPVFWNKEKVDILLFVCTKFFKKGKKADYLKAVKLFNVKEVYEDMQNPSKITKEFNRPKFLMEFHKIFGELKQPDSTSDSCQS